MTDRSTVVQLVERRERDVGIVDSVRPVDVKQIDVLHAEPV